MRTRFELLGVDRMRAALQPTNLYGPPLVKLIKKINTMWRNDAKKLASVDLGTLRGSITARMDARPVPSWGTVGSTLGYARAVHEGRRAGARMPPPDALTGWAARHGWTGSVYVLARSIGRRGIKPRPFLRLAWERTIGRIPADLRKMLDDVGWQWSKK